MGDHFGRQGHGPTRSHDGLLIAQQVGDGRTAEGVASAGGIYLGRRGNRKGGDRITLYNNGATLTLGNKAYFSRYTAGRLQRAIESFGFKAVHEEDVTVIDDSLNSLRLPLDDYHCRAGRDLFGAAAATGSQESQLDFCVAQGYQVNMIVWRQVGRQHAR